MESKSISKISDRQGLEILFKPIKKLLWDAVANKIGIYVSEVQTEIETNAFRLSKWIAGSVTKFSVW